MVGVAVALTFLMKVCISMGKLHESIFGESTDYKPGIVDTMLSSTMQFTTEMPVEPINSQQHGSSHHVIDSCLYSWWGSQTLHCTTPHPLFPPDRGPKIIG